MANLGEWYDRETTMIFLLYLVYLPQLLDNGIYILIGKFSHPFIFGQGYLKLQIMVRRNSQFLAQKTVKLGKVYKGWAFLLAMQSLWIKNDGFVFTPAEFVNLNFILYIGRKNKEQTDQFE